jgi:hypothetical protein
VLATPTNTPSSIYILLGWLGGIGATVIGSVITNKIRIYQDERKSHRDDLKQNVLIPLRSGLEEHFRPLVFTQYPAVTVGMGMPMRFDPKAKATEEQTEQGDVLFSPYPSGAIYAAIDRVLLEDAKKNHYRSEMTELQGFETKWAAFSSDCYAWVSKIAQEILVRSGLPAFPTRNLAPGFHPYVAQFRLAVFVYKRLFQQHAPALRVEQLTTDWVLQGDGTTALGTKEQIDGLLQHIQKLLETEQAVAQTLIDRAGVLQKDFQALQSKLEYAIASRRLHNGCDLVTLLGS